MGARPDKMANTTGVKFLLKLDVNVFLQSHGFRFGTKKFWRKDKFGAKKNPLAWAGGIF